MCLLLLKHAFLGNFSSMQNIPSDLSKQQEGSSFPNAFSLSAPLRPQGKPNFSENKIIFFSQSYFTADWLWAYARYLA